MTLKEKALHYHEYGRPGKLSVTPTKPCSTQAELSLAYTPGVAEPCLEIEKDPLNAAKYTARANLVAVISNGTAVLGLGDIGPLASKPVMEGKGVLFKEFADVDVFDIEINEKDPDKLIQIIQALEPTFGGINLEDIKAPECFKIEEALAKSMKIPVFHDDQHGTAIITSAALVNALEIQKHKPEEVKVVFLGAGAGGVACAKMFTSVGVKRENIYMVDRQGLVTQDRAQKEPYRGYFAQKSEPKSLDEVIEGAHVFMGLSGKGLFTADMLRKMAKRPIVFACANPDPEIDYHEALATRDDLVLATGRSDYPNQVNNVLGFPFVFRGALDVGATRINEEMKLAACHALANLAKASVPLSVCQAYGVKALHFGPDYIIPKALDPRVLLHVAPAVAQAAMESGVATRPIQDWEAYHQQLCEMIKVKITRDEIIEEKKSVFIPSFAVSK
ncbi:MAG: malate dehydrogenase [Deltaproteobacteria bacterium]|nr:malate dehydrogenase [Deltaproteobacteria bacterium]